MTVITIKSNKKERKKRKIEKKTVINDTLYNTNIIRQ